MNQSAIKKLFAGTALATAAMISFGALAAEDKIVIGFVTAHHLDQFQERIWEGARAAAADLGVEVQLAAPDNFDPEAQLAVVQNLVNSGVDAIATPATSESMAPALNAIIESGIPVVTFNLISTNVKAPFVGEGTFSTWKKFGTLVAEKLGGAEAKGKVIMGLCAPGFAVLENRALGTAAGLKEAGPNLEVLGPYDVKLAATENYAAWEALAQTNPDTIAMLGLCAPDIATLAKVKAAGNHNWLIAGSDTTPENLAAIDSGAAWLAFGQSETLQGYMPVAILVDALRNGKVAPEPTFFDSGEEFVTKDSVDEPYDLEDVSFAQLIEMSKSSEATIAYYRKSLEGGQLKDWKSLLQPIENQNK